MSYTPKHVLDSPAMSFGNIRCLCSGVANFATGCVAYTLACIDCAPAIPAPLLHPVSQQGSKYEVVERTLQLYEASS